MNPPLTIVLLAGVQHWLQIMHGIINGTTGTRLRERLERAERYLIERNNRDEADACQTVLASEIGGEG